MKVTESIVSEGSVAETSIDELELQEKQLREMEAKVKATKVAKRDKGLPNLLQVIAQVMVLQKQLGVNFIPLVRKDYIIRETVRWLKKATAQEVEVKIGEQLQRMLGPKEISLTVIDNHLKEKSRTEETGADGKMQQLTPWYKWDRDGYVVIERVEE